MRLYLLRHFESEKNTKKQLSKDNDDDILTGHGRIRCLEFAELLSDELKRSGLNLNTIISSSSKRALQTSHTIAAALNVRNIQGYDFLKSTDAGPYAGLSAKKIKRVNRAWFDAFQLYKAGLFNQYNFDGGELAVGAELKSRFEQRVIGGLIPLLDASNDDTTLVVASRSSLTAIHLYYARTYYGYPQDFYGYVSIDLGSVTILERNNKGSWKFLKVNALSPRLRN